MINKQIILGRVGKDAETKTIGNGQVTNFSIATSESYKDKEGNWQEKTEWHNITAYGKQAEYAGKIKKGDLIYLEGKKSTRQYESNGATKYHVETIINHFRKINAGTTAQPAVKDDDVNDLPF